MHSGIGSVNNPEIYHLKESSHIAYQDKFKNADKDLPIVERL